MSPLNNNIHDFTSKNVLYEDNHLLVVQKPSGLLAQGDATSRPNLLDQAKEYVKQKYDKPGKAFLGLVHRLDRQVTGVMVFARTSKAAARLGDQFRKHSVRKVYWAVVEGVISPAEGKSEMLLRRNRNKTVPAGPDDPKGQHAALLYRTVDYGSKTSLVEIDLQTGRRHQIRAQLSLMGHPIMGDEFYGSSTDPVQDSIGLMAKKLVIAHPTLGHEMEFEIQPPEDWPWLPLK